MYGSQRSYAGLGVAVQVGLGVSVSFPPCRGTAIPALIRAHGEGERIMMAAQGEQAIAKWGRDAAKLVVVRPVAEREATFAVQEMDRYLRAGYDATKRALET